MSDQTTQSSIRIKEFRVNKLFGHLNYRVPFKNESIAILHGPNGCGKTTVLKLLKAVAATDFVTLRRIHFESAKIIFYDNRTLEVQREQKPQDISRPTAPANYTLRFIYMERGGPRREYSAERRQHDPRYHISEDFIERALPQFMRVSPREWMNRESNNLYSTEEILELFPELFPPGVSAQREKRPEWLIDLAKALTPHLILTQRLLRLARSNPRFETGDDRRSSDVVEIYSNEIKTTISKKLAESVTIAQSRDRTFPIRLLQGPSRQDTSDEAVRAKFNMIEDKRRRLIVAGLLEPEEGVRLPERRLADMEMNVLWLYLQDVEDKLKVFDDLQMRIEIFMEIINFKLKPKGKSINVTRDQGFVFEVLHPEQRTLEGRHLSSGEQHEVVLFYELLFKANDGALILIDEPEISLHVNWQRVFLSDLEKVVKLTKHNILIATHSPQIINNRWDLAVALDGGVRHDS